MAVDFTGIIFGEFFIGYQRQEFDDGTLETIAGPSGGVDIDWNVTPLTTVSIGVVQEIGDTTQAGSSGINRTTGGVRVDHELLRSLILSADASLEYEDFGGIDRTDYTTEFGLEAKYFLNRYLFASGGYSFRMRQSNSAVAEEFDQHIGFVRLGVQY